MVGRVSRLLRFSPLALTLVLSGCAGAVVLHPDGSVGKDERSLIITAAALMLLVVIPVIVLTLVFAIRYRANNRKARYEPQWADSRRIELVVWAVPLAIVIVLGVVTWISTHRLDPFKPLDSPQQEITIDAIALDWKWLFIYPDEGVASVNEVAFPANVPVRFKVTSDTVMNSFFIPDLGSQIYAMAGMQTEVNLRAEHPGTHDGIAANFSGRGFAHMGFKAISMTKDDFAAWIAKLQAAGRTLDGDAYHTLAQPSDERGVSYYSSVTPHLFEDVVREHTNEGSAPAAQMDGSGTGAR